MRHAYHVHVCITRTVHIIYTVYARRTNGVQRRAINYRRSSRVFIKHRRARTSTEIYESPNEQTRFSLRFTRSTRQDLIDF